MLLTISFSLSQGVLGVWLGVMNMMIEMNINLDPIGLSQVRNEKKTSFCESFQ